MLPTPPVTQSLLVAVTSRCEGRTDLVRTVMEGRAMPIRVMSDEDAASAIPAMVNFIAQTFGARRTIPSGVLDGICEMIETRFGHLGIMEVKEAYQMFAAGEITDKAGEMYDGEINARNVGAVLSAYCEKRNAVVRAIMDQEAEQQRQDERRAKSEAAIANTEAYLLEKAEKARNRFHDFFEAKDWILSVWYTWAYKRGMISFSEGEAEELFERAGQILKREIEVEIVEAKNMVEAATIRRSLNQGGESVESRHKNMYRKLAFWEKVVMNQGATVPANIIHE